MTRGDPASDEAAAGGPDLAALRWVRRVHAEKELLSEISTRLRVRRRRRLFAGSGIFAALLVGIFAWNSADQMVQPTTPRPHQTATISLPERQMLPDGSLVELKGGAEIGADYSGTLRQVTLRQGEAHFQVVKSDRPFVVEAAGVKVRAVGTAFSVQLAQEQVEVIVTEGRVQLASRLESSPDSGESGAQPVTMAKHPRPSAIPEQIMDAGYRAVINFADATPRIDPVSSAEMLDRLAWRIPSLEFSRTPLSEIVDLMNEHGTMGPRKVRFVIADPGLAGLRLSGFLRADNSEGLVALLESTLGVVADRQGDIIALRQAQ